MSLQDGYVKKHNRQMTEAEKKAIIDLVPYGKDVRFSPHALHEMEAELCVDQATVLRIFEDDGFYYVPEFAYNQVTRKWKLVVRGKSGWCAVVTQDLTIPTVWFNPPEDNHSTLNLNVYDGTLDVLACIRESQG